ncbi:MAG: DUF92 domain-containing protein [Limnochordaceae bacterium]|nr:DUF92 domain-containing protein [Limnochordaceae bacterium]
MMPADPAGPVWPVAGIILGPAVAAAGFRARALSRSGAVAAAVVGAVMLAAGGLAWALILLAFFVSGSALTAWRRGRAGRPAVGRDAAQVLANGGVATLAGLMRLAFGAAGWRVGAAAGSGAGVTIWDLLAAGSLAAMTADTWASEIGVLSGARPRLLIGGRVVAPGTSGAVSGPGTAAGLAGALVIATLAGAAFGGAAVAAAVLVGGVVGLFVDSWLGATLQARFECRRCGRPVEVPRRHLLTCSGPVEYHGGLAWLDNDGVNALGAACGALVAAGAAALL